jgi:predicted RNase H-like HicB family nuclease
MFKYSINLMWSDEDESYVATIPEFPGLSAFGETPGEAVEEAKIAADGFIKVFKEDGRPLPEPALLTPFSGQLRIRMPKSLHASLTAEAEKECVSLNTYIVHQLSEKNAFEKVRKEVASIKPLVFEAQRDKDAPYSDAMFVDRIFNNLSKSAKAVHPIIYGATQ